MDIPPGVSLPDLYALSYRFCPSPPAGRAMARIEIVTSGGSTFLSMPEITLTFDGGEYTATIEDAGRTWTGKGTGQVPAIIALLADRAGYRAAVSYKDED